MVIFNSLYKPKLWSYFDFIISRSQAKINENFAYYFLKTKDNKNVHV